MNCAGDCAFKEILKPLDIIWDGIAQTVPSFSSSLTIRANYGGWDRVTPHGILEVNSKRFLQDSHYITKSELVSTRIART